MRRSFCVGQTAILVEGSNLPALLGVFALPWAAGEVLLPLGCTLLPLNVLGLQCFLSHSLLSLMARDVLQLQGKVCRSLDSMPSVSFLERSN